MSVDVEDYFQVEAFSRQIPRSEWNLYPCRVEDNTRYLLDLFDATGTRATFFILGWVAERYPALCREIAARGHEPACHSYWHRLIYDLQPEEFRQDTRRAKNAIEQAVGSRIVGYRAPSYSITARSTWALDILSELGFEYDSSIFPVSHDIYGFPEVSRKPFRVKTAQGSLLEVPITTFRISGGRNWPVGGGGYLRIPPFWYTRLGIERARRDQVPLVTYIHPWEIDPEQPRIEGVSLRSRFRHYTNLGRTSGKLRTLTELIRFDSFRDSGILDQFHPTLPLPGVQGAQRAATIASALAGPAPS